jgi:hypothetical protein
MLGVLLYNQTLLFLELNPPFENTSAFIVLIIFLAKVNRVFNTKGKSMLCLNPESQKSRVTLGFNIV